MEYTSIDEMKNRCDGVLEWNGAVSVLDRTRFRSEVLDRLAWTAAFGNDPELVKTAAWLINRTGIQEGVRPSSVQEFYEARGRGEYANLTVPAINIRGMTYDTARSIFRAANALEVGALILEIARSEIGYTEQRPLEYGAVTTAAALREGFEGPLFLQGDHFQVNAKKYAGDPEKEMAAVRDLIEEAIAACFFNIDIDTSTLVDLSKTAVMEQQQANYEIAAELTRHVRNLEPSGITISVGGEIGEVGGRNSTVEELEAFMEGYGKHLASLGEDLAGISKISVQTGTTHGGVPLADGSVADVKLDFDILEKLSRVSREKYGLAGAVQHGASTLPDEAFHHFPQTETAEVHLATGFQNIIYDSDAFPGELRREIYTYLNENFAGERKEGQTDEQFIYKTRKKGFGPFKKQIWSLPEDIRSTIGEELEGKFRFLFEKLNVGATRDLVGEKTAHATYEMPL